MGRGGGGSSHPDAFNPITPTEGHLVLSPVSLASRDQDGGPYYSTIDDRHLRSHGKIGDCEQSTVTVQVVFSTSLLGCTLLRVINDGLSGSLH